MIKNIITNYILPFLFFIILIFGISYKVLPETGTISYNDGTYSFDHKTEVNNNLYDEDYFGVNRAPIIILLHIKKGIIGISKNIGINDNIVGYIITFGLIFLTSIIYYLIFYKLSNNVLYGILCGTYVILNNIAIENIYFGFIFNTYLSFIGLLFLIYVIYESLKKEALTLKAIIVLVLSSILIVSHIHFISYIIVLFLYLIYHNFQFKKEFLKSFIILSSIIIINCYWIIPFLTTLLFNDATAIYSGNVDAVYQGNINISNVLSTFSLRQYFNNISLQLVPGFIGYLWYIYLFSIVCFSLITKKGLKNNSMFFLILFVVFFNISMGPNSPLTGWLWTLIWDNFSIFHFFRSFTRFLLILIPLVLVIVGISFKNNSKLKYISIIGIILLFISHYSLFSGNLNSKILTINLPKDIEVINKIETGNILILPNNPYESYNWANQNIYPNYQTYFLAENIFISPIIMDRASINLSRKTKDFGILFSNNSKIDNNFIDVARNNGISNIILSKDSFNVFNRELIDFENYKIYFDENLNTLYDGNFFTLYQIPNPVSTITLDNGNIEVKKVSSVEYDLTLKLDSESDVLRFYKNFDSNWRLYDESGREILLDHRKHNETFNKWIIDQNSFSGKKDVNLKLYFKMQDYYKLGMNITLFFLLFFGVFCIYSIARKNNEK